MSKWGRDPAVRPVPDHDCIVCGGPVRVRWDHDGGRWRVSSKCNPCERGGKRYSKHKRTGHGALYKKDYCEMCGFVAEHPCQLDVDHIDGNRFNNDPENFQTLCANCHRLKTHEERDYANRYHNGVAITADGSSSGTDIYDAALQLDMWSNDGGV